jgi:hypothetical protein
MRQLLISISIVFGLAATAAASGRYPTQKRYVNQTGEVVMIGQAPQLAAFAEAPVRTALPSVKIVPVAEAPSAFNPAPKLITTKVTDWPTERGNR